MLLDDDGTTALPRQLERRLERLRADYEAAKAQARRDRLHLRGQPRRALHDLQQPQLPLRRSRPAPRPVLAALLEAGRQDRLQAALRRRRRPLPRVDRQPPRARSRSSSRCATSPARPASRSSPAKADRSTAPSAPNSGLAELGGPVRRTPDARDRALGGVLLRKARKLRPFRRFGSFPRTHDRF